MAVNNMALKEMEIADANVPEPASTEHSTIIVTNSNHSTTTSKEKQMEEGLNSPHIESSSTPVIHLNNLIPNKELNRKLKIWGIYEKVALIGEGSISNIYRVRKRTFTQKGFLCCFSRSKHFQEDNSSHENSTYYALKTIDTRLVNESYLEEMRNEIDIFKSLDHPHLLKAYDTYHSQKKICIIMELCTGGDLYSRFPYPERQAGEIMTSILSAVSYMHKNNIMHRDLKFENIMFESDARDAPVKIIDFGLSKKYLDPSIVISERVGTIYTMAPEVIETKPYSFKADMFSLGVIAYMLLSHQKPFWGMNKWELERSITACIYNFDGKVWKTITNDAKDFIRSILIKNPDKRLSAEEAKKHIWLQKISSLSSKVPDPSLIDDVEQSLVRYADSGEFKRPVLNVLAHRTSSDDIKNLRLAFDSFDSENDGIISHKEFKEQLLRFNLSDEEVNKMFESIDVNHTGNILYHEFLAATLETQHYIEEANLRDAFDSIDSDESGYISKEDLYSILGNNCQESYIKQIIQEVDTDSDGLVSFEDVLKVFRDQKKSDVLKSM